MCRPTKQQLENEQIPDYSYQEHQQENFLHAIVVQQQIELEQLLQVAENLKNDIIKLHDQEQELIHLITMLKKSRTSLLCNIYSFMSNKNILLFVLSGFLTGFYIIPTISKIFSSTRV